MSRVALFGLLFTCSALCVWAQEQKAIWIWYPGDFELWLSSKIQVERTERGMFYPPFWRMDRHTPLVRFEKTVDLAQEEEVTIRSTGSAGFTTTTSTPATGNLCGRYIPKC